MTVKALKKKNNMSGQFKMKSAAHGGPMRRNFPSAFPKLDILLDGESIGSGSDKRSSEEARLKAEQQSKLNTYVEGTMYNTFLFKVIKIIKGNIALVSKKVSDMQKKRGETSNERSCSASQQVGLKR